MHKARNQGFTLIEMVFAVVIGGLLIAIALPIGRSVLGRTYDEHTRKEMTQLAAAVRLYVGDTGSFPDTLGDLTVEPNPAPLGWNGPYMTPGRDAVGDGSEMRDGWNTPYAYFELEEDPHVRFLRSGGPDGTLEDGNDDDITISIDVADEMRRVTRRELATLHKAIKAYNGVHLPDSPLPSNLVQLVTVLQEANYLLPGDDLLTDAWGYAYVPGPAPVQEIYLGSEALGGGPGDDDDDDSPGAPAEEMVTLCHVPAGNPSARYTTEVAASTVEEHLAHGDTLGPCCPLVIDFETDDDFVTPLRDGQQIRTPPLFGNLLTINCTGPNFGAALFDTDRDGPNDPGRDNDLLVGLGNALIAQENNTQTVAGFYDLPDDDAGGAYFTFDFATYVEASSITLIDVDDGGIGMSVSLFNANGEQRYYEIPGGWTTDIAAEGGVGFGVLDLQSMADQRGVSATAWAEETPAFNPSRVVRIEVTLSGSGALDNIAFCPTGEIEVLASCAVEHWSTNLGSWLATGHATEDLITSVFTIPSGYESCIADSLTLGDAIDWDPGSGACGYVRSLVQQGVVALLNADHPDVAFTLAAAQVVDTVNAALATMDVCTIHDTADEIGAHNSAYACSLE